MELQHSVVLNPQSGSELDSSRFPAAPAVFAIHFDQTAAALVPPYLSRTADLRRRLGRLLRVSSGSSRLLNLREHARRVEFSPVGSSFEAIWLLYQLNRFYYPDSYRVRLRLKSPTLLKLNLENRFPRLYPTRRISGTASRFYGPFPSRVAAERLASDFLDFFKIRRCVEDLNPDPAHPGCIYSQMHMCLAPCFAGCTDDQYQAEVSLVAAFLDDAGRPLVKLLEDERAQASEQLNFEHAAKVHQKIEKVAEVLRLKPGLVRNLSELDAVLVERGAPSNSVVFFRVAAGELRGPAMLSIDENVSSPVSLDEQIRELLAPLAPPRDGNSPIPPPPWEHLSLLARWYYSSFRSGELIMLEPSRPGAQPRSLPTRALIRACRKVLASETA